jgi:type I restriction enzyme R subunit
VHDILSQVQEGKTKNIPTQLHRYQHAPAYFGVLQSVLEVSPDDILGGVGDDALADTAIEIEKIIEKRKIRDWVANRDIQKAMMNDVEDALYSLKEQHNVPLTTTEIDLILEQVLEVAKRRDRL